MHGREHGLGNPREHSALRSALTSSGSSNRRLFMDLSDWFTAFQPERGRSLRKETPCHNGEQRCTEATRISPGAPELPFDGMNRLARSKAPAI